MTSVKVRIAVAVDEHGDWNAVGWKSLHDSLTESARMEEEAKWGLSEAKVFMGWVTAELPIPEPIEVEGSVGIGNAKWQEKPDAN